MTTHALSSEERMRSAAQLINQTSGCVVYYTPSAIIEAARRTMGGIDLDPASSDIANRRVCADTIYTQATNGLAQKWFGRVWLNWPFGRVQNPLWSKKILAEIGSFEQLCCITYACTSEQWFTPLLYRPQCFLVPRTNYLLPDGTVYRGVTKGSVVTYFGANVEAFRREFKGLGVVKGCYD